MNTKTFLVNGLLVLMLSATFGTEILIPVSKVEGTPSPEPYMFDPSKFYTIREAEGVGVNYWVGEPGVFFDHETGTFWLVYRWRKPYPDRGHTLCIAKSTDGIHFTDMWSATKDEFRIIMEDGSYAFQCPSIARASILKDPVTGKFKLFVHLISVGGAIYKLDDVDDPTQFDPATSHLVLATHVATKEWDSNGVGYPWISWIDDRYVMLYTALPAPTAYDIWPWHQRIGLATSFDGESWTRHPDNPILDVGTTWDRMHLSSGSIMFLPDYWAVYYTGSIPGYYEITYYTGLSVWRPPPPPYRKLEKVTVNQPLIKGIDSYYRSLIWLTSLTVLGKTFFYYETGTSDGSVDLRVSVVERGRVETSFSPTNARLDDIVGVRMKFYVELPYTTVTLVDKLPSELTYLGGFTDSLVPDATPTVDGNTITYTTDVAGEHTVTFDAKVTRAYELDQTITNKVNATYQAPYYPYAYPDALLSASADLTIKSFVPPSPSKSFSQMSANLGDIVGVTAKFYVTLPYTTATIVDKLPSELIYWGGFSDSLVPGATPSIKGSTITYTTSITGEHTVTFNAKVQKACDFDQVVTNRLNVTYPAAYYPYYPYNYPEVLLRTSADLTVNSFAPSFSKCKTAGPDIVKVNTPAIWNHTITINNPYAYTMNAVVSDNFGAQLPVSILSCTGGTPTIYLNKASNQYRLTWSVSLAPGASATLVLRITTSGIKSPQTKVVNSGATIKFLDVDGTQLSAQTSPIVATIVP